MRTTLRVSFFSYSVLYKRKFLHRHIIWIDSADQLSRRCRCTSTGRSEPNAPRADTRAGTGGSGDKSPSAPGSLSGRRAATVTTVPLRICSSPARSASANSTRSHGVQRHGSRVHGCRGAAEGTHRLAEAENDRLLRREPPRRLETCLPAPPRSRQSGASRCELTQPVDRRATRQNRGDAHEAARERPRGRAGAARPRQS